MKRKHLKHNQIKKIIGLVTALVLVVTTLSSCSGNKDQIYVVTREEGSGTRTAFIELAGVVDKEGRDQITQRGEVTNSTAVMLQTIAGNKNGIGYVSLGSLSKDVKPVKINGVALSIDNIKMGKYKIARPFNILTKGKESKEVADFIKYILSKEGQKIVEEQGYIPTSNVPAYENNQKIQGKITIAGSTSVAPVIEVIASSYMKIHPNVKIEIQQSGSSAGIIAVNEGVSDIGLASREIKGEEMKMNLKPIKIAMDGIGVIVNKENPVDNLTEKEVRDIFSGSKVKFQEN